VECGSCEDMHKWHTSCEGIERGGVDLASAHRHLDGSGLMVKPTY